MSKSVEHENFRPLRRDYYGNSGMTKCRLDMIGRTSLDELLQHIREVAPYVPDRDITINTGQIIWDEPPTDDELTRWRGHVEASDARHEEWERATYERLRAKFAPDEEPCQ